MGNVLFYYVSLYDSFIRLDARRHLDAGYTVQTSERINLCILFCLFRFVNLVYYTLLRFASTLVHQREVKGLTPHGFILRC
jgi:hypothetical protein